MLLFIPLLPTITTLREELASKPSSSIRLLLATILLVTSQDISIPDKLNVGASLRRLIQQDLLTVLMMESKGIR